MCDQTKSFEEFHKAKGNKDGYKNYCRECYKTKIYSYGEKEGAERRKTYSYQKKGYKQPKPIILKEGIEGKECNRCGEWQPLTNYHKHHRYAYGLNLYCKPCDLKAKQKYFTTEKGKNNSHRASSKRRSRMKGANYIPYDRKKILRRDKYICQVCGIKVHDRAVGNWNTPDKAHLDHIISLEDGGETREENLRTLCRTCNLSKGGRSEGEVQLTFF